MSKTVDEKVVSMRFDNKDFEKNVHTSMSTIDKLKAKLSFKGATKGLDNVSKSAKKCDMSPLSQGVQAVQLKFSAMQVVATTALANITNTAVNAGKRVAAAFTIEPVKSGFQEYETQINAIQTILANTKSKGSTLDDVNNALNELNHYADKTIYNFTEMTRNIGTFTAAGIDLKTSVSAIKGIANLAAVSGSTSQQASTAMYQLSQALAAGTVKLQDWNSVVNAGMGGQIFQDSLKETARVHGIAVDDMIEKEGSFRESLKEGWITADVLTETLSKFTGDLSEAQLKSIGYTDSQVKAIMELGQTANDAATKVKTFSQLMDTLKEAAQSGWTESWQTIIGDFDQSKTLFTYLSDFFGDIIQKQSDARNTFLKGALGSKWDQLSEKITGAGGSMEDFKAKLIETAKEHNVDIDGMIKRYGSFEATLSHSWLTTTIFSETIGKMIGNISKVGEATADVNEILKKFDGIVNQVIRGDFDNGQARVEKLTAAGYSYAQVQNLVNHKLLGTEINLKNFSDAQLKSIGYTDEQVKQLRELQEQADKSGTSLNELIKHLDKPSGRYYLINGLKNMLNSLVDSIKAIKKAWTNVFPPLVSDTLYNLLEGFYNLSQKLKITDDKASKITRTFEGLFSILELIVSFIKGVAKRVYDGLHKAAGGLNIDLLEMTARLGDLLKKFSEWVKSHDYANKAIDGTIHAVSIVIDKIKEWFDILMQIPIVKKSVNAVKDSIVEFFESPTKYFDKGKKALQDFFENIYKIPFLGDLLYDLKSKFENFSTYLKKFAKDIAGLDKLSLDNIATAFSKFVNDVWKDFTKFKSMPGAIKGAAIEIKDGASVPFTIFATAVNWCTDSLVRFLNFTKNKLSKFSLGKVITMVFGLATIKFLLKASDFLDGILDVLHGFGAVLNNIGGAILNVGKAIKGYTSAIKWKAKGEFALKFAESVAIVVGCLILLTKVDTDALWSATQVFTTVASVIAAFVIIVTKSTTDFDLKGFTAMMIAIGLCTMMLTKSLTSLCGMKWDQLWVGITGISILLGELVAVTFILTKNKKQIKDSKQVVLEMLGFAIALKIMAKAVKILADMDPGRMILAAISLGLLVTAIFAVMKIVNRNSRTAVKAGGSMLLMSLALLVMVRVIKMVSQLSPEEIGAAIGTLILSAAFFNVFAIAMRLAGNNGKYAVRGGAAILAMSIAMSIMVFAIKLITKLSNEDIKKGINVITKIGILIGALMVVSRLAGQYSSKAGDAVLKSAIAILLISFAMSSLAKVDDSGLEKALNVVKSLMRMMAILIVATGKSKDCSKSLTRMIVAFAILIAGVAFLSMIEPSDLKRATVCLDSLIGMFALVVLATSKLKELPKSAVAALGVMAGAIVAFGIILINLSEIDWHSNVTNAAALSGMLIVLTVCAGLLAKMTKAFENVGLKKALKQLAPIGLIIGGLIGIAFALVGLMKTMKGLDPVNAITYSTALSEILLAISISAGVIGKFCKVKPDDLSGVLLTMTAMGGILLEVAIILGMMDGLDPKKAVLNATALGIVCLALGVSVGVMDILCSKGKSLKGGTMAAILGTFAGCVAGLGLILGLMDRMNIQNGIKNATALAILMGALGTSVGTMYYITSQSKNDIEPGALIKAMVALAGCVTVLGVILGVMDMMNIQNGIKNATALAILMGALGTSVGAMYFLASHGKSDFDPQGLVVSLGALTVCVGLLGGVLGLMELMKIQNGIENAKALSILAIGLGIAMIPFSAAGRLGPTLIDQYIVTAHGLLILMGVITAIAVAAGAIALIPGADVFLGKGVTILTAIGEGIGGFFGGIVKGFKEGRGDAPQQVRDTGKALQDFSETTKPFFEQVKTIDESTVTAVKNLVECIALICAGEFLEAVTKFISGSKEDAMASFGDKLCQLAHAVVRFTEIIAAGDLDTDLLNRSAAAAKMLVEVVNAIEPVGGLMGEIFGEVDLCDFGTNLAIFGEKLVLYGENVSPLTDDMINKMKLSAEATKPLIEVANAMPKTGGVLQWLAGESNPEEFGHRLRMFGWSLVDFAESASQLTDDDVKNFNRVKEATQPLIDMANTVPKTGVLMTFLGEHNLEDFGTKLETYGDSLVKFGQKVTELSSVNTYAITTATTLSQGLSDMANSLPTDSSIIDKWFGEGSKISLSKFGDDMAAYGEKLNEFGTNVTGIDFASVDLAIYYAKQFADLFNSISGMNFDNISGFSKAIKDLGKTSVSEFVSAFSESYESVKSCGSELMSRVLSGVQAKAPEVQNGFVNVVKNIPNRISSCYSSFKNIGQTLISQMSSGINNRYSVSMGVSALESLLNRICCSISTNSYYSMFYNLGKYCALGLRDGLNDYASQAVVAASNMAISTYYAARRRLNVNSPSRIFRSLGSYVGEGFVLGIDDWSDDYTKAGINMATSVKSGLGNAIKKISDLISTGIDSTPTIRPILDLSNVEQGATTINSLLSRQQALSIGSSMGVNSQNGMTTAAGQSVVNFTQNNYSPKALSRIDIYRQTKNQMLAYERMVK